MSDAIDDAASDSELSEPKAGERAAAGRGRAQHKSSDRATNRVEREVRLVDAQAIRAVAHEARQLVIDVLYSEQRPYTATQLAELTGLSPSAMSYHLRALERWGVVDRAEDSGDARNRPWRASGTLITITGQGAAVEAAQDVLFGATTEALRRRMDRTRTLPADERKRYIGLATGELWLTDEQVADFSLLLQRATAELRESGWTNEPASDKTRVAFVWSLLPDPYAGRVESEAASQADPPG